MIAINALEVDRTVNPIYLVANGKKWIYVLTSQLETYYIPHLYRRYNEQWIEACHDSHIRSYTFYRFKDPNTGECIVFHTLSIDIKQDMYNEVTEIELIPHLEALMMFYS